MLIDSVLLYLLMGVTLIIVILVTWFLFKKRKKRAGIGIFVGILISFVLSIPMVVLPTHVYVVYGAKQMTQYSLIGKASYKMENGGEGFLLESSRGHCHLINDSGEDIVVKEIIYGKGTPRNALLETGRMEELDRPSINYFFDNEPPISIETSNTASGIKKLWVVMEADFLGDEPVDVHFEGIREKLE